MLTSLKNIAKNQDVILAKIVAQLMNAWLYETEYADVAVSIQKMGHDSFVNRVTGFENKTTRGIVEIMAA